MKKTHIQKMTILLLALGLCAGRTTFADDSLVDRGEKGIKKGGEAAVRGIEAGGKAAIKGVRKGGEWVGRGLKKTQKKLGLEKSGSEKPSSEKTNPEKTNNVDKP